MPLKKLIELQDLDFGYGDYEIFKGLNFSVTEGEIVGLYGENGCGKSTLLKLMIKELKPQSGRVKYDHEDIRISILGQSDRDMIKGSPLTVEELLMMYHINSIKNMPKSKTRKHVRDLMARFNLGKIAKKKLTQISGGQLQRVMIVKTLSTHPQLILLDEPLNQLDETTQKDIIDLINQFHRLGKTIVIILHDKKQLEKICDNVYVFKNKSIEKSEVV